MSLFPILIPKTKYTTTGVVFDGTNDYMLRGSDLTGNADGKKGIASFWILFNGSNGVQLQIFASQNQSFTLARLSTNKLFISGLNTSVSPILQMQSVNSYTSSSTWHHVIFTWDLSAGLGQLYVDGVNDRSATGLTLTNDNIDYTRTDYAVGANTDTSRKLDASIADLYVNLVQTIDVSVSANLKKFRSALGKPVDLGPTGNLPTGTSPIIFFRGPASAFNINLGTGGNFSITVTLTNSATSPSD